MPYIYICIKMKKKIRSREELGKMNSHFKPRSPIKYFLSPLLVVKKKKKRALFDPVPDCSFWGGTGERKG